MIATVADILDIDLPDAAAEDGFSFLPALEGSNQLDRQHVIHHSAYGYFAIRHHNWKLCWCPGSGGWTETRPSAASWKKAREKGLPMIQLYDMARDVSEQENLAIELRQKAMDLREQLDEQIALGRSTPGAPQQNDAEVVVDKQPN